MPRSAGLTWSIAERCTRAREDLVHCRDQLAPVGSDTAPDPPQRLYTMCDVGVDNGRSSRLEGRAEMTTSDVAWVEIEHCDPRPDPPIRQCEKCKRKWWAPASAECEEVRR